LPLPPDTARESPAPQEPVFLERFPEASGKHVMKLLQGIFVLGCAFRQEGIDSLGDAAAWLKARLCPVPCCKSKLSEYIHKGAALFGEFLRTSPELVAQFFEDGKLRFDVRESWPELPRDSRGRPIGMDTRKIIGLTRWYWWAWHEVEKFLRKKDPAYKTYATLLPRPLPPGCGGS
jgi:hypothetical protein